MKKVTVIVLMLFTALSYAQGIELNGTISAEDNQIKNVADPTQAQDEATKVYVDGVVITTQQASDITTNTAKVGITGQQASDITSNTAKTVITTDQANAIVTNMAKVGITAAQSNAIVANTAKTGYTEVLVSANTDVEANTAKVGMPAGTATGEMNYYNGTAWVVITPSVNEGAALQMIAGVPTWTGGTPPPPTSQVSNGAGGFYTFLSHNLGADTSLDPHTPAEGLNGDYYQWGKNAPDAGVDALIGSTWGDQGGSTANGNWTPNAKGPQDPCPAGFRVPSQAEWIAVRNNNTASRTASDWNISATNFGTALHYGPDASTKLLTLPAAGTRSRTNGALEERGVFGYFWSSTEDGIYAYNFYFQNVDEYPANNYRDRGFSVRCIAE